MFKIENLKYIVPVVLIAIIVIMYAYDQWQIDCLKKTLIESGNNTPFTVINDSLYTKSVRQVFKKFSKEEEDKWKDVIAKKDELIAQLEEIDVIIRPSKHKNKGKWEPVEGDTNNTIVKKERLRFREENGVIIVEGWAEYPTGLTEINFTGKPVKLMVAITKDKNGIKKGYIRTSTPDLVISDWDMKIDETPDKKPLAKFSAQVGVLNPISTKIEFMGGGDVKIRYIPVRIGLFGVTNTGVGAYIAYP